MSLSHLLSRRSAPTVRFSDVKIRTAMSPEELRVHVVHEHQAVAWMAAARSFDVVRDWHAQEHAEGCGHRYREAVA